MVAGGGDGVVSAGGVVGEMAGVGDTGEGATVTGVTLSARAERRMRFWDISHPFGVMPRMSKAVLIWSKSGPSPTRQRRLISASVTECACLVPRRRAADFCTRVVYVTIPSDNPRFICMYALSIASSSASVFGRDPIALTVLRMLAALVGSTEER